jgi:hypothetical protein
MQDISPGRSAFNSHVQRRRKRLQATALWLKRGRRPGPGAVRLLQPLPILFCRMKLTITIATLDLCKYLQQLHVTSNMPRREFLVYK